MFDQSEVLKQHHSGGREARFDQPISEQIWRDKYRYTFGKNPDVSVADTWWRVAEKLAACEAPQDRAGVAETFYRAMQEFRLLPAGRILAGAGTGRDVTLFNTFVMETLPDSVDGIMDTMKDAALTMKMGGGLGFDFSTIRPAGFPVKGLGCPAAGPLAAMDIANAVCAMVVTGMGRGAMMATLRCDHPDIEAFITAKSDPARLRNFNISVLITDAFMEALDRDAPWDLVWDGKPVKTISARALWDTIMDQTYNAAEPGVLFIDRINSSNALSYLENVQATNSCAEQPLPPNGACPLTSINLAKLVTNPFTDRARLDISELKHLVTVAVRFLDNVVDLSQLANEAQRWEALNKRRIGVGLTGVADALAMIGQAYGSDDAVWTFEGWMREVQNAAYLASARLARERGPFPLYDAELHLPRLRRLDATVQDEIAAHGLRNGLLTTLPPTGTTSMFGGNVSSGIEPIFATAFKRRITRPDGSQAEELVQDYAVMRYREMFGADAELPDSFVTVADLTPADHVRMQAVAQRWCDSSISKTVNCPEDISFDAFKDVYLHAYRTGCKGCTTYRPNTITGSVLSV